MLFLSGASMSSGIALGLAGCWVRIEKALMLKVKSSGVRSAHSFEFLSDGRK
jgi:hypothetical protein